MTINVDSRTLAVTRHYDRNLSRGRTRRGKNRSRLFSIMILTTVTPQLERTIIIAATIRVRARATRRAKSINGDGW